MIRDSRGASSGGRRRLRYQALERRQVFAAGIEVSPTSGLVTTEDGGDVALQVRLAEQPTADVTVNVFLGDPSEGVASSPTLSFTPENWSVDQPLVVTGQDDILEDGDASYSIALTADSADPNYALAPARILSLVNEDNEGDIPPRVVGVAIDGSTHIHAEYSVPGGSGEQLRSVPVGGMDQVRIYFNQPVDVASDDLAVTGIRKPTHAIASFSYDAATYSATWQLAEIVQADRLTFTLADAVTDASDFTLDGDWDNPTALTDPASSAFPSGDGTAGGLFAFHVTVLAGDGNRDNLVTGADFTIWGNHFFDPPGSVTFIEGDYNGDGRATGADFTFWSNTFGIVLPSIEPEARERTARRVDVALAAPRTPAAELLRVTAAPAQRRDETYRASGAVARKQSVTAPRDVEEGIS